MATLVQYSINPIDHIGSHYQNDEPVKKTNYISNNELIRQYFLCLVKPIEKSDIDNIKQSHKMFEIIEKENDGVYELTIFNGAIYHNLELTMYNNSNIFMNVKFEDIRYTQYQIHDVIYQNLKVLDTDTIITKTWCTKMKFYTKIECFINSDKYYDYVNTQGDYKKYTLQIGEFEIEIKQSACGFMTNIFIDPVTINCHSVDMPNMYNIITNQEYIKNNYKKREFNIQNLFVKDIVTVYQKIFTPNYIINRKQEYQENTLVFDAVSQLFFNSNQFITNMQKSHSQLIIVHINKLRIKNIYEYIMKRHDGNIKIHTEGDNMYFVTERYDDGELIYVDNTVFDISATTIEDNLSIELIGYKTGKKVYGMEKNQKIYDNGNLITEIHIVDKKEYCKTTFWHEEGQYRVEYFKDIKKANTVYNEDKCYSTTKIIKDGKIIFWRIYTGDDVDDSDQIALNEHIIIWDTCDDDKYIMDTFIDGVHDFIKSCDKSTRPILPKLTCLPESEIIHIDDDTEIHFEYEYQDGQHPDFPNLITYGNTNNKLKQVISTTRKNGKTTSKSKYNYTRLGQEKASSVIGSDGKLRVKTSKDKKGIKGMIGFKAGRTKDDNPCVIKLFIPSNAKVSFSSYDKYRANRVKVLDIREVYENDKDIYIDYYGRVKSICILCKHKSSYIISPCRHALCSNCWIKTINSTKSGPPKCLYCYKSIKKTIDPEPIFSENDSLSTCYSCVHTKDFVYKLGEWITIPNYNNDLSVVCAPGIHYQRRVKDIFKWAVDVDFRIKPDIVPLKIVEDNPEQIEVEDLIHIELDNVLDIPKLELDSDIPDISEQSEQSEQIEIEVEDHTNLRSRSNKPKIITDQDLKLLKKISRNKKKDKRKPKQE